MNIEELMNMLNKNFNAGAGSKSASTASKITNRPNRKTPICSDDLINLKIALETTKSVSEFLEKI